MNQRSTSWNKIHQLLRKAMPVAFLLCVSVFAARPAFSQGVPELMYYKFNSSSAGTTPNEAPASTRVGSAAGTITGTTLSVGGVGQFGTALTGTGGTTSDYITTGWNTNLVSTDWTISFWINNVPSSTTLWYLFGDAGNAFRCFVNGAPGAGNMRLTGTGLPTTLNVTGVTGGAYVLHFVRTTSPNEIKAYKNGVLQTTVTITGTMTVGSGLRIGSYTSGSALNGQFDEFRIYNRALSATEVATTWNANLGAIVAPNNASVTALVSPLSFCSGTQTVKVRVKNTGNSRLDSVRVNWTLDGVAQPTLFWNSPLDTVGGTLYRNDTALTLGTATFGVTTRMLKAWTSNPNGVADTVNLDDTINVSLGSSLSGTFTIGAGGDFTTLASAVSALNTRGVCGPVTFNVVPGYGYDTTNLAFGNIAGASATNTIVFNGRGATVTSSVNPVVAFAGASYIRLDSFNIVNYGAGFAMHIGTASHHLTLNANRIEASTTSTATTCGALIVSGSTTATTTAGNNAQYLTITNNDVIGGYYNFTLMGNTGMLDNYGHYIANNKFRDFYVYGVYLGNVDTTTFINNDINRATRATVSTLYGIYFNVCRNLRIQKNRLHDFGVDAYTAYPMYIPTCQNSVGYETEISNNLIYNIGTTSTLYAIYSLTNAATGINFYHNTINLTAAPSNVVRGVVFTIAPVNVNFKNNIISITGTGTGVKTGIYVTATSATFTSNNNVLYINSSAANNVGYWGAVAPTLTDWRVASGQDLASSDLDPMFTNAASGNLKPLSVPIDNLGTPVGVGTDILGIARSSSTPDAGGYEFTTAVVCTGKPEAGNASTSLNYACSGQNVSLSLVNDSVALGLRYQWQSSTTGATGPFTDLTSDTTKTINKTQTTTTWYRSISLCPSSGQYDTSSVVRVRTTIVPFAGTYTVNKALPASSTNYQNLSDLVDELNCVGVSGPTVFNVTGDSIPYSGNFTITNFPGVSPTSTVTFNGNGSTITSDISPVVGFSGARYVTLDSFTIVGGASYTGIGVHINGGSHHLTLNRNIINMGMTATATSCAGIAASALPSSPTGAGNNTQFLTITNNTVIGGYYNTTLIGNASYANNSGHVITGNTFRDFYVYGLYLVNADSGLVTGNDINRLNRPTVSTFYGMYGSSIRNIKYRDNRIHDAGTGSYTAYPVYVTTSVNNAGFETEFINNATYNIKTTGTIYGYYLLGTRSGMKFYHNTVSLDLASSTGTIRGLYMSTAPDLHDFRNNIISITGSGTGTKHVIYVTTGSATISSNRNVLFIDTTVSTNFIGYLTADMKTLPAWQAASGVDANSICNDPVFINPAVGNLMPLSINCDNLGTNVGVTMDITGAARSTTTPDAGAYEFTGSAGDISMHAAELKRSGVCYSTLDTAWFTLKNVIGLTADFTLNPITISWRVTGPVNTTDSMLVNSGTLAPGATARYFVSTINMSVPGIYNLKAYVSPTGINTSSTNDTLVVNAAMEVKPILSVSPKTSTVTGPGDTVVLTAASPLFPGGNFMITEVCHFKTTTGAPVGGWPAYHLADDYIEITGIPGSDLGGYVLEQWNTTAMLSTHTFPAGTTLSSAGVAVIAVGTIGASVNSATNSYYLGNGAYTGTFDSGTTPTGRVLKNSSGVIVDAVGYSGSSSYTFPAAAGVSSTQWSGNNPVSTTTCGIRLTGPDMNTPTNWIVSSATSPQDPNAVNAGVTVPTAGSMAGFQWTYLGSYIDTLARIKVGPYTSAGVRRYVASYATACGTFYDTATVTATSGVPVKLVSFNAVKRGDDVNVTWATASELNNAYFQVQRSTNGRDFSTIARAEGQRITSLYHAYQHLDKEPFNSTGNDVLYYRLRQVDVDGRNEMSGVVSVLNNRTTGQLVLHPNPNAGAFTVAVHSENATVARLRVVNALGNEVWSNVQSLPGGDVQLDMNVDLPAGVYMLMMERDGNTTTQKLVIRK